MALSLIEKALDAWGEWSGNPRLAQPGGSTRGSHHGLPPSGAIPLLADAGAEPTQRIELDLKRLQRLGIIHPQRPHTEIAEEYRRIKQPLLQKMATGTAQRTARFNLIMVTSAIAGEGKTFTALNLAISMAMEKDHTVLLIDADMSRRGLSRLIHLDSHKGLTDVLRDGQTALGEVFLGTNVEHLAVLPVGQHDPHFTELVGSSAMRRLTQQLALRYPERILIFDAPPLLGASAATVLAGLMDQIVMVVEVGKTPKHLIQEAMSALEGSKPIGVVLNKTAKTARAKYARYYGAEKAQSA